jgi:hypothetical protein
MTAPLQKFDFIIRSTVLRSEKPNKGLEATAAPNPNLMNRLIGYRPDGVKVVMAQRHGRGGMDFNKLMGGKVFAVAADAVSPVFEKDSANKPTKVIKTEDGLALYSSSGFYTLSTREHPALDIIHCYARLLNKGEQILMVSDEQLMQVQHVTLDSDLDLELVGSVFAEALSDDHNLVSGFDADTNKKRRRGVDRGKEEAEDSNETYGGVDFKELSVSKRDGNATLVLAWILPSGVSGSTLIPREIQGLDDADRPTTRYLSAEEAVEEFVKSDTYTELTRELEAGNSIELTYVQGHLMRTSVSFRRKAENVLAAEAGKPVFGDAVYIHGALTGWCRTLATLMHSQHPKFPQADYESHFYVAAPRQAEVGMNKKADGSGWEPPKVLNYDIGQVLFDNC